MALIISNFRGLGSTRPLLHSASRRDLGAALAGTRPATSRTETRTGPVTRLSMSRGRRAVTRYGAFILTPRPR